MHHTNTTCRRHLIPIIMLLLFMGSAGQASGQIVPDRLYYGVGQRVVVLVTTPENSIAEPSIKLHDARTLEVLASAPAADGRADLASLFPMLWTEKPEQVMLAQLYLDNRAYGAPLVLQPLVTPNTATRVEERTLRVSENEQAIVIFEDDRIASLEAQGQKAGEREVAFSGLRVYIEQEAVIETSMGQIAFRLRPDAAPNTAYNFMHLVQGGFYTNIIFHRIVAALSDGRPFVIQVGDPSGTGSGGPGYMVDLEKSTLPHDFGVLSMARAADPNTNGSQVFVCLSKEGTSFLDGRYTAFAQAVSGADAILKIARVPVDVNDRPLDPPMIERAYLRDAPPISERVKPVTREDAGAFTPPEPDR
ncbi:MAG: peptidylprolyl isomerase [Phycisphaerales bacterium JB052]